MFGLSIGMYLTGFTSGAGIMMEKYGNNAYHDPVTGDLSLSLILDDIAANVLSWNGLLVFGAVSIGALASGLNLLALIPLGAIMLVINFLFIPVQTIREMGLPPEVTNIMVAFFVLAEIITIFMLIRGNFR